MFRLIYIPIAARLAPTKFPMEKLIESLFFFYYFLQTPYVFIRTLARGGNGSVGYLQKITGEEGKKYVDPLRFACL